MVRTRLGRVFGRVLHVESKHRTSASFCYLPNIDTSIFQSETQCSTSTRQNTLAKIRSTSSFSELIPMYTCMYKGNFRSKRSSSFHQARLAQSVDALTMNLKVENRGQLWARIFHCVIFAFHALLAGRLSPYK